MTTEDHIYPRVTAAVQTGQQCRDRDGGVLRICYERREGGEKNIQRGLEW